MGLVWGFLFCFVFVVVYLLFFLPCYLYMSVCIAWQKLKKGQDTQAIQPNSFIPAILTGTFDLYYFVPFSMALTL